MDTQGLLWDVFVFGKTLLVGFVLVRRSLSIGTNTTKIIQ